MNKEHKVDILYFNNFPIIKLEPIEGKGCVSSSMEKLDSFFIWFYFLTTKMFFI